MQAARWSSSRLYPARAGRTARYSLTELRRVPTCRQVAKSRQRAPRPSHQRPSENPTALAARPLRRVCGGMLRITVTTLAGRARLVLEGRLGGPWVAELASCWQTLLAAHDPRPIQVDLNGLTFIDAAGKMLLREMRDQGATLAATELMTHAIVDEES